MRNLYSKRIRDDGAKVLRHALCAFLCVACAGPTPGPDKQFAGSLKGATSAAGAGAVTGFQIGSGSGPGALVGAGVGAVAGGIKGFAQDQAEEDLLSLAAGMRQERERAWVQELLSEHYKRRLELHPTRDIYPADWFFYGDEYQLRPEAQTLVREIAHLNKVRMPWSRLVVVAYAKGLNNSSYAVHLTERRARELSDYLGRNGIDPRRIETRALTVDAPVLIDPLDDPGRYNQAIEIILKDR